MGKWNGNECKSKIHHGSSHGSGLTGRMGKQVKVIGLVVLVIFISVVVFAVWDYNTSPDMIEPTTEEIALTD